MDGLLKAYFTLLTAVESHMMRARILASNYFILFVYFTLLNHFVTVNTMMDYAKGHSVETRLTSLGFDITES